MNASDKDAMERAKESERRELSRRGIDEIGDAKETEREREERRLKREAGHGARRSGKGARKATRGAFGGRRK
jgi:hypothetical protein